MIEVEGPDGTVIEFPDGTPTETIQNVMRQQYGGQSTPPPPVEAPAAPAAEEPSFLDNRLRALRIGTQGVGEGVAGVLGFPGDLLQMAGNALRTGVSAGVNLAGFPETAADINAMEGANLLPTSDELRTAAGNDIRSLFGEDVLIREEDMSPWERIGKSANSLGTEAATGAAALTRGAGSRIADLLTTNATKDAIRQGAVARTAAGDTAAAAGAGAGMQAAQESPVTRDIRASSPIAAVLTDTLAALAGGASTARTIDAIGAGVRRVPGVMTGPETPQFIDPETFQPFARDVMDMGARYFQNDLLLKDISADTLANRLRKFSEDGMSPQQAPTVGMLLGRDNMQAGEAEAALRLQNGIPFMQRDQARREKARDLVDGIATEGDGRQFTDGVAGMVKQRLGDMQAQAEQQRRAAQDNRDLNIGQIDDQADLRRATAQTERDTRVADLQNQNDAAQTGLRRASQEADRFGQQFPSQDDAALMRDSANTRIDELATGELTEAQGRRSQLYNRLENEFGDQQVPLEGIRRTIDGMVGDGLIRLEDVLPANLASRFMGRATEGVEGLPAVGGGAPGAGDTATISDLANMRRILAGERQKARTAGDFTKGENISKLSRAISTSILAHGKVSGNDALQRLSRDIDAFETSEFGPRFREGEADRFRKDFNVDPSGRAKAPPSQTADRFVKPNRPENIQALMGMFPQIDSAGGGREALREKLIADLVLSGAVDRKTGRIRNTTLSDWINKKWGEQTLEEAAPGLVNELRGVVSRNEQLLNAEATAAQGAEAASQGLKTGTREADLNLRTRTSEIDREAGSGKRAVESAFGNEMRGIQERLKLDEAAVNKGALRFAIGASPEKAIESVMTSKDPERNMAALVDEVRDLPDAMEGMRQSVREYLLDKVTNAENGFVVGKDGESARPVSPTKVSALVEQNWNTLAQVFDETQMNDLRKVHDLLKDEAVVRGRASMNGSPTKLYDLKVAQFKRGVEALLKFNYGALVGGTYFRSGRLAVEALSGEPIKAQVNRMLTQAMLDPELAQHLMKRSISEAEAPLWNLRLLTLLGITEISEENN